MKTKRQCCLCGDAYTRDQALYLVGGKIVHYTCARAAGHVPEVLPEPAPTSEPSRGLGDHIERLAKPIALALGLNCLDAQGQLRPESGCAQRRDLANRLGKRLGIG